MATGLYDELKVIDSDTHWSEPEDLWTARAPAAYRDLVPQVKEVNGKRRWVVNGDTVIGAAHATSAIGPDGAKLYGLDFLGYTNADVHRACLEVPSRLAMMDSLGIWGATLYPNVAGFGSQNFMKVTDEGLRVACVEIYNDYMAEVQAASGNRLLPMAMVPWWDADATVREMRRAKELGLRGIVTCSNPHDSGLPDYAQAVWEPVWETAEGLELPINFHIGASQGDTDWFGRVPYPSWPGELKITIGGTSLFLGNARWMANLLFTDIFERHPGLRLVSVESGVGWIPFFLESLDYQAGETAPEHLKKLPLKPSEYFKRQIYSTFWFESAMLGPAIDYLGADRVMWETDFPHPTCLYPDSGTRTREKLAALTPEVQRKILQDNAAELYKID